MRISTGIDFSVYRVYHDAMCIKVHRENGFTLFEIIAALVILGVLAATAIPKHINFQEEARLKVLQSAFGTASSNVILSFSSFLLQYGEKPIRIIGGGSSNYSKPQYWIGYGGKSTPIERDLGNFVVRYKVPPWPLNWKRYR